MQELNVKSNYLVNLSVMRYFLHAIRHKSRKGVLVSVDDGVMCNVRLTVGNRSSTNCTTP